MAESTRPQPPESLTEAELCEWHRLCDELEDAGRLEKVDRAMLTLYVELWGLYSPALARVKETGAIIVHEHNGVPGQSHHYKVVIEVAKQLKSLLVELGLNPASRPRTIDKAQFGDEIEI